MGKRMFLALILSLFVILSFAVSAKLIDGTYEMHGSPDSRGYFPSITIVVKDGKLSVVDYREVASDTNAPKSQEDYPYEPYFNAISKLNSKAVETNGDISKIDGVAGATQSSVIFENMLLAVQLQAVKLRDGIYPPQTLPADDRGYAPRLAITVKDSKIARVEFYEYNVDTNEAKQKGVYNWDPYFDACSYFADTIVKENGNILEVDAYAGATGTSENFFTLYKPLLNGILLVAKQ